MEVLTDTGTSKDILAGEGMKLYSYIIAIDDGFAPNPFFGACTLATCKPDIRRNAQVGDWVLGTGSKQKGRQGTLVFAMRVSEKLTYDTYWQDPRFEDKRPNLCQSIRNSKGDNIYHRNSVNSEWIQEDSCHSNDNGTSNQDHILRDTKYTDVLISEEFIYYGGGPALVIPEFNGITVCHTGRGYKSNFDGVTVQNLISWLKSLGEWGYCNEPLEWGYPSSYGAVRKGRTAEERRKRMMVSAGGLKGKIDGEAIKRMLYEARRLGSREIPDS